MNARAYVLAIMLICFWLYVGTHARAQVPDPLKDIRYVGQVTRSDTGATARSAKVVAAFRKQWACPSTGSKSGACAGWAIDHIIPLDCGGYDAVWNMQWLPLTIKSAAGADHKDRFERRVYGGNGVSKGCP